MNSDEPQDIIKNAGDIIERFGGIRPMATKMNVPVTTVQGWKKRDAIPVNRYNDIVAAARANNIDLADVLSSAAIANQNQSRPFERQMEKNKGVDAGEPRVVHVRSSTPLPRDEYKTHEELMAQIKAGSEQAVKASVWITTGLILLAVAGGAFLLWPASKVVENHGSRIAALEGEVNTLGQDVKDNNVRASFLKNLVPEEMQKKMDEVQTQARNLETTVTQLAANAQALKQTLTSEDAGPLSERLAALETQVMAITGSEDITAVVARVRTLEQTVNGQMQIGDAMKELQSIVDSMDGRVTTVESELAKVKEDKSTALGQTLDGVSKDDLKAAAMLMAFSQFRDSVNREAPFEDDLVLLQKLAGDNAALQDSLTKLAPQAQTGVLTPEGLSQEFKGLAGDIVIESLKGEDVSVTEKFKGRLSNMFRVEKDGMPVGGSATQETVARAQTMLDAGDVKGAMAELQTLEGPAAQTAAPFMDKAQARVEAEDVQAMVYQEILSKLSAAAPGLQNMIPAMQGGVPPAGETNVAPNIDLNAIKDGAMDMIPGQGSDMVKDDESGLAITPPQNKFKGLTP